MCDCLDEENEEGKPLTWTYVGQGRGDWAEAKNLEFVGYGKGAFVQDREAKPSIFCRSNVLVCLGCVSMFFLVPLLIWFFFFSGFLKLPTRGEVELVTPQVWNCNSPPLQGAAAAGAAIMEEAWMALDLDMDGFIPKSSLQLWQSQNLMSQSTAAHLNASKALDGMISNDAYIETLLKADSSALGSAGWVSGAWLLCDKNQDNRVTKIEMGFLQRHGSLKESIDRQLWNADVDGDGALNRQEFEKGLATVAIQSQGAIQTLFHEVQTRYWPTAKRNFCCQTQGVCGLNLIPSTPTTESTTFAGSYDCTTGADKSKAVEGWDEMHRAWCCSRQSVGCFKSISVPYDCDHNLHTFENDWSAKKQAWCCFHVGKGCYGHHDMNVVHFSFDHHDHHVHYVEDGAPENPLLTWHPAVPATPVVQHVVHHEVSDGKPVLVKERTHVYDVVHKASHVTTHFDCFDGSSNWKVGWSEEKKKWCCSNFRNGCEGDTVHQVHHVVYPEDVVHHEHVAYPEDTVVHHQHVVYPEDTVVHHQHVVYPEEAATLHHEHVVYPEAEGPAALEPVEAEATVAAPRYDCMAGFFNWRHGWSVEKRSWCCEHEQKACD